MRDDCIGELLDELVYAAFPPVLVAFHGSLTENHLASHAVCNFSSLK